MCRSPSQRLEFWAETLLGEGGECCGQGRGQLFLRLLSVQTGDVQVVGGGRTGQVLEADDGLLSTSTSSCPVRHLPARQAARLNDLDLELSQDPGHLSEM